MRNLKFNLLKILLSIIFLFALFGCGGGSAGTGTGDSGLSVQGSVRTVDGAPLSGATVSILETGDSATTDTAGEFSIELSEAPPSQLTLEVSNDGTSATTVISAPSENGTISIEIKYNPLVSEIDGDTLEVNIKLTGDCEGYFEQRKEFKQIKPISTKGLFCQAKVQVISKGILLAHVPVAVQYRGCDSTTWTTQALDETLSGSHLGVAQVPFHFLDDQDHCRYRIVSPFGEKDVTPVIKEIWGLSYQTNGRE